MFSYRRHCGNARAAFQSVCVCVCVPGFLVARHKVGLKCCHSIMAAVPARHDFGFSPSQQRQKCLPGRSVRGAKDKY